MAGCVVLAPGRGTSGRADATTPAAAEPASITILTPSAKATVSDTVPVRLQVSGVASGALVTVRLTYAVLMTRPALAGLRRFLRDDLRGGQPLPPAETWVDEGGQIPAVPALLGASTAGANTWIGVTVDGHGPTVSAPTVGSALTGDTGP